MEDRLFESVLHPSQMPEPCMGLLESAKAPGLRCQPHRLLGLALGLTDLADVEETDDAEATQVPRSPPHIS